MTDDDKMRIYASMLEDAQKERARLVAENVQRSMRLAEAQAHLDTVGRGQRDALTKNKTQIPTSDYDEQEAIIKKEESEARAIVREREAAMNETRADLRLVDGHIRLWSRLADKKEP